MSSRSQEDHKQSDALAFPIPLSMGTQLPGHSIIIARVSFIIAPSNLEILNPPQ